MDTIDKIGVVLVATVVIGYFTTMGWVFGNKHGQVRILSGGTPEYHMTTNWCGETSWEPISKS